MAIKGRVVKLETKSGLRFGQKRRQNLELLRSLSGSNTSIEQLHKEVPLDFVELRSILESLPDADSEGV